MRTSFFLFPVPGLSPSTSPVGTLPSGFFPAHPPHPHPHHCLEGMNQPCAPLGLSCPLTPRAGMLLAHTCLCLDLVARIQDLGARALFGR